MPLTSPGNDDDTGENHQPTLRKNTAEPVEQTLKQNSGGAVARVRGPAVLGFLVLGAAQVLGHLLVQGRLQHAFGELFEQSVGPCQVQSFFPWPCARM